MHESFMVGLAPVILDKVLGKQSVSIVLILCCSSCHRSGWLLLALSVCASASVSSLGSAQWGGFRRPVVESAGGRLAVARLLWGAAPFQGLVQKPLHEVNWLIGSPGGGNGQVVDYGQR